MSGELLRLDGVGVRLGGREILRDVSLGIRPGEFMGLIGPNGAGKTTLLRVMLGLQPVTRGSVLIGGAPRAPRDASIGYVPQNVHRIAPASSAAASAASTPTGAATTRTRPCTRITSTCWPYSSDSTSAWTTSSAVPTATRPAAT